MEGKENKPVEVRSSKRRSKRRSSSSKRRSVKVVKEELEEVYPDVIQLDMSSEHQLQNQEEEIDIEQNAQMEDEEEVIDTGNRESAEYEEVERHEENETPQKFVERLMIKEIVMYNFKSYYGKRTIGPLHKNFTTIVGPNGSGKSNLIECLLFVFGKRAKKMRVSTNIGDLIHNSSVHQNCLSAFVQVNFQYIVDHVEDENEYEVLEGTQFSVKREIRRSEVNDRKATSSYYINDEKKNFTEVEEFLKIKHQIDLDHDRFLILQGEVESISMMPPKASNPNETGLLEYLEDIIGSSKYTEQVEQLKIELERRREEKIEKQNIVAGIKTGIRAMHQEKEEVMNYVRLETQFYKVILLKDYAGYGNVKKNIETVEKLKEDLDNKVEECNQRFLEKEKEFAENGVRLQEIKKKVEANDEKAKALDFETKDLEKKDTEYKNDIKRIILEAEDLKKANASKTKEIKKFEQELKQYHENIPKMEMQNEKLKKKLDKSKVKLDEIEAKIQSEIEEVKAELQKLEEKKGRLKLKIQKEDNEIERCKEMIASVNVDREQKQVQQLEELIEHERENMLKLEEDYKNI